MYQKDLVVSGVGGQGILSVSYVIDFAALKSGYNVKQNETHGMSQRGGPVVSHLRLSSREIYSGLIAKGTADLILSMEPLETLKYIEYLKTDGYIISDINPVKNMDKYPDEASIIGEIRKFKRYSLIDSLKIARDAGNLKAQNMVLVGAASKFLEFKEEYLKDAIKQLFAKKPELIELNLKAFDMGREAIQREA